MGHGTLLGPQKQQRPNEIHVVVALINSSTPIYRWLSERYTHSVGKTTNSFNRGGAACIRSMLIIPISKYKKRIYVNLCILNKFQAHGRCEALSYNSFFVRP